MKKWFAALAAVVLALSLGCMVGCSGESSLFVGCVSSQTQRSFAMEYALFNGRKEYRNPLAAGDVVRVQTTTTQGELRLTVQGANAESPIYTGIISEFSSFTINVDESGSYVFTVVAASHSGSFSVSW